MDKMASLNDTDDIITSVDMDRGDIIPPLEEAINIFAEYNAFNGSNKVSVSNDNDSISNGKPLVCEIDNSQAILGKDLEAGKEKDMLDPNCNLVNTRVSIPLCSWRKSTSGYKPAIPIIAEDTTKQDKDMEDQTLIDKGMDEIKTMSGLPQVDVVVDICGSETPTISTTDNVTLLETDRLDEKTTRLQKPTVYRGRRHSMENVTMPSQNDNEEDDSHKVEKNNIQDDLLDLMSNKDKSNESKATSLSLPNTPRSLTPSCLLPGKSQRPRRYSLADVSNMGLSVLEDKSFAREIRQHQLFLQNRNIADPIIEANNESEENDDTHGKEEMSSSGDLTSPRERAKYLQRRRASHGTIAPILPNLHLPRSPRSSVVYSPPSIQIIEPDTEIQNDDDKDGSISSANTEAKDDSTLSESENQDRLNVYRRNKRRSSWACSGTHSNIKPISTLDLIRQSSMSQDLKWGTPASRDPYHMTVHFITDPNQADGLRNFLRPITSAIVPQFAIFNYAERSVNVCMPEDDDEDHTRIPALAIVVFIQEELGAERLENAQGFLKKEPWVLHHRSELGPNAVPYPTNNQDYYAHANNMPLWAVRQVHCGSDRLRCQLFVSDEHWSSTIQLYSTILGHGVQYQKEDFCFFNIYSDPTRNLEIQLSLKRLPTEYTPLPMEDVILQFKIVDMGSLVPLLPNVCSPISEKRWQTTDFDGNKILLLRGSDKSGRSTPRLDYTGSDKSGRNTPRLDYTGSDKSGRSTPRLDYTGSDKSGRNTPRLDYTGSDKSGRSTPRLDYTGVSNRRSASSESSDSEGPRGRPRGRRHKQNLTTIV